MKKLWNKFNAKGNPVLTQNNPDILLKQYQGALVTLRQMLSTECSVGLDETDMSATNQDEGGALGFKQAFDKHGSDKATVHNYDVLYEIILAGYRNRTPLKILEIGIGTNFVDVPSNMGRNGRPGASLRAFCEVFPNSHMFGADLDRRILFEEERIRTYFVDQESTESLEKLARDIGQVDIVIDDGLHAPHANLNTFLVMRGIINEGGMLIFEDVWRRDLEFWRILAGGLKSFDFRYVKMRGGGVVYVRRRKP